MPKVLVTGATGFAGSHLTRRLLDEGQDVRILVRPTSDASGLELSGAEIARGDVTDADSVRRAVDGVEVVYHLAALFRRAKFPDADYRAVNYDGTLNLLQAALDAGVRRFIHCSTVGVLGHIENPAANEETPYNPGDIYQVSKCEAEKAALGFHRERGLPVVVIRPAGIYGPGDLRWLKLFRAISRRRFVMLGSGTTLIHWVYISDLIDAFRLAAESPNAVGKVYIAAGERYVTLNELVETIAKSLNVPPPKLHIPVGPVRILSGVCEDLCRALRIEPPIFRRRVDFFIKDRAFDITKARADLGYAPKVDLPEGVSRTARWYKEQGLL
ncbi:MAG: NAD-dependent epimerase/dehydratase family protein [Armatimonadetes bacterium]|nr:NAD-dependent epimerase/dehydratase family protein [Armatimonadota bacterium]